MFNRFLLLFSVQFVFELLLLIYLHYSYIQLNLIKQIIYIWVIFILVYWIFCFINKNKNGKKDKKFFNYNDLIKDLASSLNKKINNSNDWESSKHIEANYLKMKLDNLKEEKILKYFNKLNKLRKLDTLIITNFESLNENDRKKIKYFLGNNSNIILFTQKSNFIEISLSINS